MGVIDAEGNWVVAPQYFVDEGYDGWTYGGLNEGMYLVWDSTEDDEERVRPHYGFFDVPSGYFSGIVFMEKCAGGHRKSWCPSATPRLLYSLAY